MSLYAGYRHDLIFNGRCQVKGVINGLFDRYNCSVQEAPAMNTTPYTTVCWSPPGPDRGPLWPRWEGISTIVDQLKTRFPRQMRMYSI